MRQDGPLTPNVSDPSDSPRAIHRLWRILGTWEALNEKPTTVPSIVTAPHGPIQISDGRLIYVGNAQVDERLAGPRQAILCVESTDKGRSWHLVGTVCSMEKRETDTPFSEPHVAEVDSGQLVVVMRSEMEAAPNIHSCRSSDGGRTWSTPEQTPLNGYHQPPHLLRLIDGRLLCTYGRRAEPFGQRACLSDDGGRSWLMAGEIVLRDDAPNADLGYPATVEIEPGELLSVYYQIHQPGEKVSINATRWSL